MLHPGEIEAALDLQQRSYRLLQWVARNLDDGELSFTTAHDGIADEVAALQWIEANWRRLPASAVPKQSAFVPFANLLASYLTTSFDLVEEPGTRWEQPWCSCPLCTRLVAASHLRPKKVLPADKRRARALKFDHVTALAAERGKAVDDATVDALIDGEELGRCIAMATWAEHLLRRSRGDNDGPAVLALWREFAWKPEGSPDPEFEPDARVLFDAELAIASHIDSSVRRVLRIDHAIPAPPGMHSSLVAISEPNGWERIGALGVRIGDDVELRRPDGSVLRQRITGFVMGTPNPEQRAELAFGNGLTAADLPPGTELWLPSS